MGPVKCRPIFKKTVSNINKGQSEVPFLKVSLIEGHFFFIFQSEQSKLNVPDRLRLLGRISNIFGTENIKDILINVGAANHNSTDNRMLLSMLKYKY